MGTPKGCFGADDKVVLASTGREAYAGGGFCWGRLAPLRFSTECRGREHKQPNRTQPTPALSNKQENLKEQKKLAPTVRGNWSLGEAAHPRDITIATTTVGFPPPPRRREQRL